MKKKYFVGFLIIFLGFITWSFWPLKALIFQKNWFTGTTLLLITNENEARPCGGFVTVFGEFTPKFPPSFSLKNSYHYAEVPGKVPQNPLINITNQTKFWDLATEPDMQKCAQNFHKFYEKNLPDKKISQTIFLPISLLEDLLKISGPIFLESPSLVGEAERGLSMSYKNVFSALSRLSANTDRHDEESLENRKKPLANFAKKILKNTALKFWKWREVSEKIAQKIQTGEIYAENISPKFSPKNSDLALIEWNTGGGKSSRYLEKNLQIFLREDQPEKWTARVKITANHTGPIWDEPLSQDYSGTLELKLPENFNTENISESNKPPLLKGDLGGFYFESDSIFIPIKLKPGEAFTREWQFDMWEKNIQDFSVFVPRNQELNLQFTLTNYPQKILQKISKNLEIRENTAKFFGKISVGQTKFEWSESRDKTSPFITIHEGFLENQENSEEEKSQIFQTEIHFNENIKLTNNFTAKLIDRNYHDEKITENLEKISHNLLPDNHTLVINFPLKNWQPGERFYLQISGITDFHGNALNPKSPRTIIMR